MRPNPEFLDVVQANFPADTPLVVGCQAGARSVQACEMLADAGYTNVANVLRRVRRVARRRPGWVHAGLPVETAAARPRVRTLREKTSGDR